MSYNKVQILRRARDLVGQGWTQRTGARDANYKVVSFSDESAVCYCALGAIFRAAYEGLTEEVGIQRVLKATDLPQVKEIYNEIADKVGKWVGVWNDAPDRTQAEVLQVFDEMVFEATPQQD